ncbi:hypothetical protein [Streptosporangium sp. NPDC048865]|uniref:hypothetical protein n=1 Tax=Streptosporangium sp. NPDC048865 TaxID=3155766 RepID=UPI00343D5387
MPRLYTPLQLAHLEVTPAAPASGGSVYAAAPGQLLYSGGGVAGAPLMPGMLTVGTDVGGGSAGATVTALALAVQPGTYSLRYVTTYTATNGSTGIKVQLTGPATSGVSALVQRWTSATACVVTRLEALSTWSATTSVSGGTTARPLLIDATITCTAAGTLNLLVGSSNANTATLKAGSSLTSWWLNAL